MFDKAYFDQIAFDGEALILKTSSDTGVGVDSSKNGVNSIFYYFLLFFIWKATLTKMMLKKEKKRLSNLAKFTRN